MSKELLKKAEELVNKCTAHTETESGLTPHWVMSLIDDKGYPAASIITASRADGFKWISFCTGYGANKPNRARSNPKSCVYLYEEKSFSGISLTGKIEISTDLELKKQMWYKGLENHFSGPEDKGMCVMLFKPEHYNIFIDYQNIYGNFDGE